MSAAAKLLADFHAQGVGVRLDGGSVMVTAPKGAVTDVQAATLRQCKAEIISILEAANDRDLFEERAAIIEYDGNLPRDEAERLARMPDEHTPPTAEYIGFDYGPSDPFQALRRCPDLLRSAGGAS